MTQKEETVFLSQFQRRSEAGQIIETLENHQAYEEVVGHRVTRNIIYYLLHRYKWRKVEPAADLKRRLAKKRSKLIKKSPKK